MTEDEFFAQLESAVARELCKPLMDTEGMVYFIRALSLLHPIELVALYVRDRMFNNPQEAAAAIDLDRGFHEIMMAVTHRVLYTPDAQRVYDRLLQVCAFSFTPKFNFPL